MVVFGKARCNFLLFSIEIVFGKVIAFNLSIYLLYINYLFLILNVFNFIVIFAVYD